jgi:hypothetical protein
MMRALHLWRFLGDTEETPKSWGYPKGSSSILIEFSMKKNHFQFFIECSIINQPFPIFHSIFHEKKTSMLFRIFHLKSTSTSYWGTPMTWETPILILSMGWFQGKSKPETKDFPIKYRVFL